jgi:hypothetical protein
MQDTKPLWMITFDPKIPEKSFQERALFSSFPSTSSEPLGLHLENNRQALEFLSKVNASLKNMTEAYLEIAENNEEFKPRADEIRERLDILNKWLQWIRSWLEPPPPEKEEKEEDID